MSFCQDCVRGVRHGGTPEGKIETIGGITCYVGTPAGDYPKDKVILYIADAFGIDLFNTEYASTLVSDCTANPTGNSCLLMISRGTALKLLRPITCTGTLFPLISFLSTQSTLANIDIGAWAVNHGPNQTRPILDAVVAALKEEGVTLFGATRYCFGGRYVFDLAFDNVI